MHDYNIFFQSYSNVEYQTLENSSKKKFNEFIISQFEMLVIGRTIIKLWSLYPYIAFIIFYNHLNVCVGKEIIQAYR